jgi:serine/threonine protein kinase
VLVSIAADRLDNLSVADGQRRGMPGMEWPSETLACDGLTWKQLSYLLVKLLKLRAASSERIVTIAFNDRFRFVQFRTSGQSRGLRCETLSNHFLTKSNRLPKSVLADLSALGWMAPRRHERHFWCEYAPGTQLIHPAMFAIRTMRDVFGASNTARLQVWCGQHSMGGVVRLPTESSRDLPILPKGSQVTNLTTGAAYRVGKRLGYGGFGAVYQVTQTRPSEKFRGKLCLKIAVHPKAWHREAYFGELLTGVARAIAVYDSFAVMDRFSFSEEERLLYCLVTERAAHGDLFTYLERRGKPWTQAKACREVCELLKVLVHLHEAGAVHRDLTPSNVLVVDGEHLKLGDFGIARHGLQGHSVLADAFHPAFVPPNVGDGHTSSWRAADDIFQMGVILAGLLGGSTDERAESADVKSLECSHDLKAIIQRAIGDRRKRYQDAAAMLAAIRERNEQRRRSAPFPNSLTGKFIAFTGALTMRRREAMSLAKLHGARVQPKVTSRTDIIVQGATSKQWKADIKGQKLLDVDRERERGHDIRVINEREFLTLARSSRRSKRSTPTRLVNALA